MSPQESSSGAAGKLMKNAAEKTTVSQPAQFAAKVSTDGATLLTAAKTLADFVKPK